MANPEETRRERADDAAARGGENRKPLPFANLRLLAGRFAAAVLRRIGTRGASRLWFAPQPAVPAVNPGVSMPRATLSAPSSTAALTACARGA